MPPRENIPSAGPARSDRRWNAGITPEKLPNLVIIGAQKCGTTSLHHYLDAHPAISMARIKETNFFLDTGNWNLGLEWYGKHFDPAARVRGEASPYYANLPESAQVAPRMKELIPGAKLIYLVRHPVDRMVSDYVHHVAEDRERRPLRDAILDPDNPYVQRSRYATQLRPFLSLFAPDQILIETQDRLLGQRQDVLSRIFRFLGVDESFRSPDFERIWQETAGKGTIYRWTRRFARRLPAGGGTLPRSLRWPIQRLIRSDPLARHHERRPILDEQLRAQAREWFAPELQELERVTQLDLGEWTL